MDAGSVGGLESTPRPHRHVVAQHGRTVQVPEGSEIEAKSIFARVPRNQWHSNLI